MNRKKKILILITVLTGVFLLVVWFAVGFASSSAIAYLEKIAGEKYGVSLSIDSSRLKLRGEVSLRNLSIVRQSDSLDVRCGLLNIRFNPGRMLWGVVSGSGLVVSEVLVDDCSVNIAEDRGLGEEKQITARMGKGPGEGFVEMISVVRGERKLPVNLPVSIDFPLSLFLRRGRIRCLKIVHGTDVLVDSLDADMSLSLNGEEKGLEMTLFRAMGVSPAINLRLTSAAGDFEIKDGIIDIDGFSLDTNRGRIFFKGRLGPLSGEKIDDLLISGKLTSTGHEMASFLSGIDINERIYDFSEIPDTVGLEFEINGGKDNTSLVLKLTGNDEDSADRTLDIDLTMYVTEDGRTILDALTAKVGHVAINATGSVGPAGKDLYIEADAGFSGIDAANLPWTRDLGVKTDLAMDFKIDLLIGDVLKKADLSIERLNGTIEEKYVRGGNLIANWKSDDERKGVLFCSGGWKSVENSGFHARGTIGPGEKIDLDYEFRVGRDDPVLELLAAGKGKIKGRLWAEGHVFGDLDTPGTELSMKIAGFDWNGYHVSKGRLSGKFEVMKPYTGGKGNLLLENVGKGNVESDSVSLDFTIQGRDLEINHADVAFMGYHCRTGFELTVGLDDVVDGVVKEVFLETPDGDCLTVHPFPFTLNRRLFLINAGPAEIDYPGGEAVFSAGKYSGGKSNLISMKISGFPLSMLQHEGNNILSGNMNVTMDMILDAKGISSSEVNVSCKDFSAGSVFVESMDLNAATLGNRLIINNFDISVGNGWIKGFASLPFRLRFGNDDSDVSGYEMNARWKGVELDEISTFFHIPFSLTGKSRGAMDLLLGCGNRSHAEGEISVERLSVHGAEFDFVDVNFSRTKKDSILLLLSGTAQGRPIAGSGYLPLHIDRNGFSGFDHGDSLVVELFLPNLDPDFIGDIIPGVERTGGNIEFTGDMVVGGHPFFYLNGMARLYNATIDIPALGRTITNVNGTMDMKSDRWDIRNFSGLFGGGTFTIDGSMQTNGLNPVDSDLTVKFSNVPLDWIEYFDGTAGGKVHLQGIRYPEIQGNIILDRGVVTREFKADSRNLALASGPTVIYDLDITSPGNLWIRNSEAEIELEGSITMTNRSGRFGLIGDLKVLRGKYFILRGNKFRVVEGTISFLDPEKFDPVLDIIAETIVREKYTDMTGETLTEEVPLTLKVNGALSDMHIEFESEGEPIPEEEAITLLVFGRRDLGSMDDLFGSGSFLTNAGIFGAAILEAGLGDILDTVEIEPGAGTLNDTIVGVGKYVSDELYIYYSQYLAADPRAHAGFEYRINRFLTVNGSVDDTDTGREYSVDLLLRIEY